MLPHGWAFMAQKVCSGLLGGGRGGTKEVGVRCLDFVFVIVDGLHSCITGEKTKDTVEIMLQKKKKKMLHTKTSHYTLTSCFFLAALCLPSILGNLFLGPFFCSH